MWQVPGDPPTRLLGPAGGRFAAEIRTLRGDRRSGVRLATNACVGSRAICGSGAQVGSGTGWCPAVDADVDRASTLHGLGCAAVAHVGLAVGATVVVDSHGPALDVRGCDAWQRASHALMLRSSSPVMAAQPAVEKA
jgi:hypothetical protein